MPYLERAAPNAADLIDCKITGHIGAAGQRVIHRRDLINFCFHMEQLTGAGVPILDGLNDLRESTDHPRLREVVTDLIESIEGGLPLSGALAQHGDIFDATFTSLILAGEQSGKIAELRTCPKV